MSVDSSSPFSLTAPEKSKMELRRLPEGGVQISSPAQGFGIAKVPMLLFLVVWFGFITVWTSMAVHGAIFMAFFSVPFWVVGVFIARGLLMASFESQEIVLRPSSLRIQKKTPWNMQDIEIPYRDITKVGLITHVYNLGNYSRIFMHMGKMKQNKNAGIPLPSIQTSSAQHSFLEHATEAEQEWAMQLIRKLMGQGQ